MDLESRALRVIVEAGSEGIPQSELWKRLGVNSKYGSRFAIIFERRGLIEGEGAL